MKQSKRLNRKPYLGLARITSTLLLLCLLLPNHLWAQSTWRISLGGNDSATGKDDTGGQHPWATLSRLNTAINNGDVQAGDVILLERGGTWRGYIDLNPLSGATAGLTIDAYGTGSKPLILGTEAVTSWTNAGGGVWEASPSFAVKGLFAGNERQTLARFPNSGFFRKDATTAPNQVEIHDVSSGTSCDGANLRIRSSRWTWETHLITATTALGTGVRLTLADDLEHFGTLPDNADWGYYLDNHPDFLDQEGEWYFDGSTLSFMSPGGANPAGLGVEASVYDHGILSTIEISNLSIRNLAFRGQAENGVTVITSTTTSSTLNQGLVIEDCEFYQQGVSGMVLSGSNASITDNLVEGALGNGIRCGYKTGPGAFKALSNSDVSHNVVRDIGLVPGLGVSGENGATGIHFQRTSQNNTVDYNELENIGYAALSIYLTNSWVRHNQIRNSCLTLDDGGAIYSYGNSSNYTEVAWNYVENVPGNDQGVRSNKIGDFPASGIYLDNGTHHFDLHDNTVVGAGKSGIFINLGSLGHSVTDNVFYGNKGDGIMTKGTEVTVDGNLFYSLDASAESVRLVGTADKWVQRGDFSNNVFANPYSPYIVAMWSNLFEKKGKRSLDQWQNLIPGQAGATNSLVPFQWTQIGNEFFEVDAATGTELATNGDFSSGTSDWTAINGASLSPGTNACTVTGGGIQSASGISLGSTSGTTYYLLSFNVSSSGTADMTVELTGAGQSARTWPLSSTARSYQQILAIDGAYTGAKLKFNATGTNFTLSGISLKQVDVISHDPGCKSHLFTNWTASARTAQQVLDAETNACSYQSGWVDLANQAVTLGNVTLQPYQSVVLVYTAQGSNPPSPTGDVLYVVADSASLTSSEQAVRDHLQFAMGLTVELVSDEQCQASDADGRDLVLVSGDASPSLVAATYNGVATPVMIMRPQLLDDMTMGLTGGNTTTSDTQVEINAAQTSHPMAAGLSGLNTVSSTGAQFGRIFPANLYSGAIQIASLPSSSAQVVFGYDQSPAGNGAGRRSAFMVNVFAANQLSSAGWELFEGAVCWTIGNNCQPPVDLPPAACFSSTGNSLCSSVQLDASCSTTADASDQIVDYSWNFGDGSSTGNGETVSHQYLAAGTYAVVLTVTDNNGQTDSETLSVTINAKPEVLLLVYTATSLTQGEQDLHDRLVANCYDVIVREDDDLDAIAGGQDPLGLGDVDLVIVSAWCADAKVGTHLTNAAVPVLALSPFVYDNLGMSLTNGTSNGQTDIYIDNASSPLAGGNASGALAIATVGVKTGWGTPSSSAHVAQTGGSGSSSSSSIFGYEANDAMPGSINAPARRTGFFINKNNFADLNSTALDLLDQAICWTLGSCGSSKQSLFSTETSHGWAIFPNPTANRIEVDLGQDQVSGEMELSLFNLQGMEMARELRTLAGNSLDLELKGRGLLPGMYLLRVKTAARQQTFRVVYRP